MANVFTEVIHQSYGDRIKESFALALVGLLLFLFSFPVLFYNEGRAVHRAQTLEEGKRIVTHVAADHVSIDKEGKLIHLNGKATSNETLTDVMVGIEAANVIKLRRVVEMYQWEEEEEHETEEQWGGDTEKKITYHYIKKWSDRHIDSDSFKYPVSHRNPSDLPMSSETLVAQQVTLGAFTLSNSLVRKMNNYQDLPVKDEVRKQVLEKLSHQLGARKTHFDAGRYYVGKNPAQPEIGDLRIKFEVVWPTTISVVAKQVGSRLTPYTMVVGAESGLFIELFQEIEGEFEGIGGKIELFEYGTVTAPEMFEHAEQTNVMLTWKWRLIGFLMMDIGLTLMFMVLRTLAAIIPFFARLVGILVYIISFVIAATLSLITIGIAWLFYRPVLSIALFVIAGIVLYLLKFSRIKPQQAPTVAQEQNGSQPLPNTPQPAAFFQSPWLPQQPMVAQFAAVPQSPGLQQPMIAQPTAVPQSSGFPQQQPVMAQPMAVLQSPGIPQQSVLHQPMAVPQSPGIPQQPVVVQPVMVAQPTTPMMGNPQQAFVAQPSVMAQSPQTQQPNIIAQPVFVPQAAVGQQPMVAPQAGNSVTPQMQDTQATKASAPSTEEEPWLIPETIVPPKRT
jgi:hypothetical protein